MASFPVQRIGTGKGILHSLMQSQNGPQLMTEQLLCFKAKTLMRCSLCSRAPCRIKLNLRSHLKWYTYLSSSPFLSCLLHFLNSFSWKQILHKILASATLVYLGECDVRNPHWEIDLLQIHSLDSKLRIKRICLLYELCKLYYEIGIGSNNVKLLLS